MFYGVVVLLLAGLFQVQSVHAYDWADPECRVAREKSQQILREVWTALPSKSYRTSTGTHPLDLGNESLFSESILRCFGIQLKWFDQVVRGKSKVAVPVTAEEIKRASTQIFLAFTLMDENLLPNGGFALTLGTDILLRDQEARRPNSLGLFYGRTQNPQIDLQLDSMQRSKNPAKCGNVLCKNPVSYSFALVLHEYAHNLDFAIGRSVPATAAGAYYSLSPGRGELMAGRAVPTWISAVSALKAGERISAYADTNETEHFAESFTGYLLVPNFKCRYPEIYRFFAKYFPANAEVYGSRVPFKSLTCPTSKTIKGFLWSPEEQDDAEDGSWEPTDFEDQTEH